MERLAPYLIRSSFSQERMKSLPDQAGGSVPLQGGQGAEVLQRPGEAGRHRVPRPRLGQQLARYYDFLSDAIKGKRRKEEHQGVEGLPTVLGPQVAPELGKNFAWARLIQTRSQWRRGGREKSCGRLVGEKQRCLIQKTSIPGHCREMPYHAL